MFDRAREWMARPVPLSILFSILEICAFLAVTWAATKPVAGQLGMPLGRVVASNVLPNLGGLFVGIATTWYVVFTYFILRATDKSRRHQTEPLLYFRWVRRAVDSELLDPRADHFSTAVCKKLGEISGAMPAPVDDPQRFVNLDIENLHEVRAGFVEVRARASLLPTTSLQTADVPPVEIHWQRENTGLDQGQHLELTALDLGGVASTMQVQIELLSVSYSAAGSKERISNIAGDRSETATGVLNAKFAQVPRLPEGGRE